MKIKAKIIGILCACLFFTAIMAFFTACGDSESRKIEYPQAPEYTQFIRLGTEQSVYVPKYDIKFNYIVQCIGNEFYVNRAEDNLLVRKIRATNVIEYDVDNGYLAVIEKFERTDPNDTRLCVYNIHTGKQIKTIYPGVYLQSSSETVYAKMASVRLDGDILMYYVPSAVCFYNLSTGAEYDIGEMTSVLTLNRDDHILYCGGNQLKYVDTQTGELIYDTHSSIQISNIRYVGFALMVGRTTRNKLTGAIISNNNLGEMYPSASDYQYIKVADLDYALWRIVYGDDKYAFIYATYYDNDGQLYSTLGIYEKESKEFLHWLDFTGESITKLSNNYFFIAGNAGYGFLNIGTKIST